MTIAIGADHRGFLHKQELSRRLAAAGHQVVDCGCDSSESADYPDAAFVCATSVGRGESDAGILICGSGVGMSIAANKVAGVRASLCHDAEAARATREHNDSNILCLSADRTSPEDAVHLAEIYLGTTFAGGRHARRVDKITAYEAQHIK
jgi:ribose 5-phosphate isomerase B